MSCSKELRYPNDWVKIGQNALLKPVDDSLIETEELIKWTVECGICDEMTVRKYIKNLKPFECMRSLFPIFPYTKTWQTLFKVMTQFFNANFIIDDIMEENYNLDDMKKLTNAYYQLDEKLKKMFPVIPSLTELQQFLQYLSNKEMAAIITIVMDHVSRATRVLLQDGGLSENTIFSFRNRLSNGLSLYLQAVLSEKFPIEDTDKKLLWDRLCGGAGCAFSPILEASSHSLGKVNAHMLAIAELYSMFALYVSLVNDIFSYEREVRESIKSESLVRMWQEKKESTNVSEATYKMMCILDSIAKYVYKRGEKIKVENPNNPELHVLLNQIGYSIAGCYFMHADASDRYKDCQIAVTIKGLEGNDLQEWLDEEDDSYGRDVVEQFLVECNPVAKNMIDVIAGVISASGQHP